MTAVVLSAHDPTGDGPVEPSVDAVIFGLWADLHVLRAQVADAISEMRRTLPSERTGVIERPLLRARTDTHDTLAAAYREAADLVDAAHHDAEGRIAAGRVEAHRQVEAARTEAESLVRTAAQVAAGRRATTVVTRYTIATTPSRVLPGAPLVWPPREHGSPVPTAQPTADVAADVSVDTTAESGEDRASRASALGSIVSRVRAAVAGFDATDFPEARERFESLADGSYVDELRNALVDPATDDDRSKVHPATRNRS